MIRWLLVNGARTTATDDTGETPLCTATRLGNETAVHVLDDKIFTYALKHGNLSVLRMLLENIQPEQYHLVGAKLLKPALKKARAQGNVRAAGLLKEKMSLEQKLA